MRFPDETGAVPLLFHFHPKFHCIRLVFRRIINWCAFRGDGRIFFLERRQSPVFLLRFFHRLGLFLILCRSQLYWFWLKLNALDLFGGLGHFYLKFNFSFLLLFSWYYFDFLFDLWFIFVQNLEKFEAFLPINIISWIFWNFAAHINVWQFSLPSYLRRFFGVGFDALIHIFLQF